MHVLHNYTYSHLTAHILTLSHSLTPIPTHILSLTQFTYSHSQVNTYTYTYTLYSILPNTHKS